MVVVKDPISVPALLQLRTEGRCDATKFSYGWARKRSRPSSGHTGTTTMMERLVTPRLYNPQGTTVLSFDTTTNGADNGRYLLTGDTAGNVSIYDLSPWGSQSRPDLSYLEVQQQSSSLYPTHGPIQRATAPLGRFILSCKWFSVDSGMFFSCSRSGSFHVWDTNEMLPVLECHPFQFDSSLSSSQQKSGTMSCMEISSSNSIAVGSPTCPLIKLIDIRSGSSSHTLTGHTKRGVSCLSWSPACPHILASGGMDSTVMLWDIRKAGSLARITVMDSDPGTRDDDAKFVARPYYCDLKHLRNSRSIATTDTTKSRNNSKQTATNTRMISVNNYSIAVARKSAAATPPTIPLAHTGGCVGLAFCPSGHYLISAGGNGDLSLWDLRTAGRARQIPRRFVASAAANGGKPVDSSFMGRAPLVPTSCQGNGDTTIWTRRGTHLCGYSLQNGGAPEVVLKGHIGTVSAIAQVGNNTGQLVSSSSDGLLLLWGPPTDSGSLSSETVIRRRGKRRVEADHDDW